MSDAPQGSGWWQASDGRFYPPEQHPDARPTQPVTPVPPPPQQSWVAPAPAAQATWGQAPQQQPAPKGNKGVVWLVAGVAALVVLLIGVAIGAAGSDQGNPADTQAAEVAPGTEATTTAPPQTTLAPTTVAPETTTAPTTTVPAPPSPAPAAAPVSLMPSVVCMNLQAAQDLIQTTGVFFSRSFDATGAGRAQVVDSNWVVVSQDPAPGTPITEGQANLGAVKYGEPSPC
jgi:hypothetical protein